MRHRTSSGSGGSEKPSRSDALGTLVLWPSGSTEVDAARDEADPWPVLVVVIGTDSEQDALLDLLDTARSPTDTITNSRCWWSVDDPDRATLCLAVRVTEPARFAMDIAVPAQCFLGLSDILAAGATIGVTSRRHARRLTIRTDDRASLDEIVLLGGRTSSELGDLAELLCGVGGHA
ncbi:MAG TPA: hypothetical protein VH969_19730 [Actinophytocola sp.]|jgi:hypothetical protein|uniref:hypothetical protein n=1 Tax=Actinophytocola sp. TaxID=1872138 RepID=UPI002F933F2C